jgi:hypothetical protein
VTLVSGNEIDLADTKIETWSFQQKSYDVIWWNESTQTDMHLVPMSKKQNVTMYPCADFGDIFTDFPKKWIDVMEDGNTGDYDVYNCRCEPGHINLWPADEVGLTADYYYWSGGCDGASYEITKAQKRNNVVTVWYNPWGTEIRLTIAYEYWNSDIAKFTSRDEGGPRTIYRVTEEGAANLPQVQHYGEEEERY